MVNREFVIDTQILYEAESTSSPLFLLAMAFLISLAQNTNHFIVLDFEGKILNEYSRMFGKSTLKIAQKMFLHFKNQRRIQWYCGAVPQAPQNELKRIGFDDSDLPFVGVASKSADKLLVAEESDYNEPVKLLLNQALGIKILKVKEASGQL